jgi:hypothetical protein
MIRLSPPHLTKDEIADLIESSMHDSKWLAPTQKKKCERCFSPIANRSHFIGPS